MNNPRTDERVATTASVCTMGALGIALILAGAGLAALVSNLLVVLCSDSEVQPVINTGTLYS